MSLLSLVRDVQEAIYYLENKTGKLDKGESVRRFVQRSFMWGAVLIVFMGVLFVMTPASRPTIQQIYLFSPGTIGSIILALAPLRKDVVDLHYHSGAPDGVRKDLVPNPTIRDINRITDRTIGLMFISITFFQQLFV